MTRQYTLPPISMYMVVLIHLSNSITCFTKGESIRTLVPVTVGAGRNLSGLSIGIRWNIQSAEVTLGSRWSRARRLIWRLYWAWSIRTCPLATHLRPRVSGGLAQGFHALHSSCIPLEGCGVDVLFSTPCFFVVTFSDIILINV